MKVRCAMNVNALSSDQTAAFAQSIQQTTPNTSRVQAGTGAYKESLDAQKAQGEMLSQMMRETGRGQNIDIYA